MLLILNHSICILIPILNLDILLCRLLSTFKMFYFDFQQTFKMVENQNNSYLFVFIHEIGKIHF